MDEKVRIKRWRTTGKVGVGIGTTELDHDHRADKGNLQIAEWTGGGKCFAIIDTNHNLRYAPTSKKFRISNSAVKYRRVVSFLAAEASDAAFVRELTAHLLYMRVRQKFNVTMMAKASTSQLRSTAKEDDSISGADVVEVEDEPETDEAQGRNNQVTETESNDDTGLDDDGEAGGKVVM